MEVNRNPLLNTLVLQKIFEKLKFEEQKEFRLVNRIWRDSSLEKWRRSLVILMEKKGWGFSAFLELEDRGKFEAPRLKELPFRRFRISTTTFKINVPNDDEAKEKASFSTFWNIVGPTIEHLEIFNCWIHCTTFTDAMKWILLEKCPNLKELRLIYCQVYEQEPEVLQEKEDLEINHDGQSLFARNLRRLTVNKIFYKNESGSDIEIDTEKLRPFFAIIPNLKELSYDYNESTNLLDALALSSKIVNRVIKLDGLCISSLFGGSLSTNVWSSILNYLRYAQPTLKRIEFDGRTLKNIRSSPFYFHQFLNLCCSTLTKMQLTFFRFEESWMTDLSGRKFSQLQNLSLSFYSGDPVQFDFQALCGMPFLKTFSCKQFGSYYLNLDARSLSEKDLKYERRTGDKMGNELLVMDFSTLELKHLEEFEFDMERNFGEESLRKLGNVMRNLKKLKLVLLEESDEDIIQIFGIIREVWLNLEEITFLENSTFSREAINTLRLIDCPINLIFEGEANLY